MECGNLPICLSDWFENRGTKEAIFSICFLLPAGADSLFQHCLLRVEHSVGESPTVTGVGRFCPRFQFGYRLHSVVSHVNGSPRCALLPRVHPTGLVDSHTHVELSRLGIPGYILPLETPFGF